ncbi:hypothetical protein GCM10012286_23650 [Streptomyces lasiicapitis]|uniref:Glycine zipper 2TM domain-containing protein n=1 Tax=Streptomyces lasiicapitis TaxID=1923961 RepID=A0ABQ2LRY9_9ACTN|nr:hypothetical protein GCM10012286_23650 [Streptomyces lasiicapitis]
MSSSMLSLMDPECGSTPTPPTMDLTGFLNYPPSDSGWRGLTALRAGTPSERNGQTAVVGAAAGVLWAYRGHFLTGFLAGISLGAIAPGRHARSGDGLTP